MRGFANASKITIRYLASSRVVASVPSYCSAREIRLLTQTSADVYAQNPLVPGQRQSTHTPVAVNVHTKSASVGTSGMQISAVASARRCPVQVGTDSALPLVHVRACAQMPKPNATVVPILTMTLASANAIALVRAMIYLMQTASARGTAVMCAPGCAG